MKSAYIVIGVFTIVLKRRCHCQRIVLRQKRCTTNECLISDYITSYNLTFGVESYRSPWEREDRGVSHSRGISLRENSPLDNSWMNNRHGSKQNRYSLWQRTRPAHIRTNYVFASQTRNMPELRCAFLGIHASNLCVQMFC